MTVIYVLNINIIESIWVDCVNVCLQNHDVLKLFVQLALNSISPIIFQLCVWRLDTCENSDGKRISGV